MFPNSAPYRLKVGEGVACACWCDGGLRRCTGVAGARAEGSGFGCCQVLALLDVAAGGWGGGGTGPLLLDVLSLTSSSCFFLPSSKESLASTALMSGTVASSSSHDNEDEDAATVALSVEAGAVAAGPVAWGVGLGLASSAMVEEEGSLLALLCLPSYGSPFF